MRRSLSEYLLHIFIVVICFLLCLPLAGSSEAVPPLASFESIGPFGGDVRSLLIDSQNSKNVFLGTSNGRIFRSSDAGNSWTPIYPGIGEFDYVVDTIIQHPSDPKHLYAGAWDLHSEGGGLFESTDGGSSWKRVMLPHAFSAVRGMSICRKDPSRMIIATLSGPYVSDDGGHRWKNIGGRELQKAESVAIDPVNPQILYVGTWRLGYRSNDFGKTWVCLNRGMPLDSDVFSIAISRQNPEVLYSSACSGVYRSANRAHSWKRLKLLASRFTIRAQIVDIDPVDPNMIYSGTTEGLFVSHNEGQTWSRLTSGEVTVNAIQVDPGNNRRILIGTEYDGVLLSENGGRSWKAANSGFIRQQVSWISPDPSKPGSFTAGVQSGAGGLYYYDGHARTWTASQIAPGMRILSFLVLPDGRGKLAGTAQGLYWQAGRTSRWTKLSGSIAKRTVYSLSMDPLNPVVYAGTDQGIYRTSVESLNFRMPPGYRFSPVAWCLATLKANPGVVFAGTSLGLLRSWDRGTTWSVISAYGLPDRAAIDAIAISPANNEHLLAGTTVGLYESRNGGVHWSRIEDHGMAGHILSILFLDDSGRRILVAEKTSNGLFYSNDGGRSWGRISLPRIESAVNCLTRDAKQPSRIYAGTQSDGVYILEFP
jgi:photosystem II stability/assembly factor-like uncharacterized protein